MRGGTEGCPRQSPRLVVVVCQKQAVGNRCIPDGEDHESEVSEQQVCKLVAQKPPRELEGLPLEDMHHVLNG